MKKILFSLAVMAGLVTTVSAQEKKLALGAKAGLNVSTFTGDAEGAKSKIGFYLGATLDAYVAKSLSISPELYYSAQGAKTSDDYGKGTSTANYLNLPVLVKYHAGAFNVATGPQIGFLLSAKTKYDSKDGSISTSESAKDFMKSTDFSWAFGAGYKLYKGLGVDARYNIGLSNIAKESGDAKVKNGVFQIGLNYTF